MKIVVNYKYGKRSGMGEHSEDVIFNSSIGEPGGIYGNGLCVHLDFKGASRGITNNWTGAKSDALVNSADISMSIEQAKRLAHLLLWAIEQSKDIKATDGLIKLPPKRL